MSPSLPTPPQDSEVTAGSPPWVLSGRRVARPALAGAPGGEGGVEGGGRGWGGEGREDFPPQPIPAIRSCGFATVFHFGTKKNN